MAEELQSLLDKINNEGVKKAQAEHDRIVNEAKAQAKSIVDEAKSKAAELELKAQENVTSLQKRSESAIKQAARDILLELEQELKTRIMKAVSSSTEVALNVEFMTKLITDMANKFMSDPQDKLTVLTASKDVDALQNALQCALKQSFADKPKVFANSEIKGGMEVSFKDGELYFDFTSDAILELIGSYVAPKLAELLK